MQSTKPMRDRARELATPIRDDFDRAVLAILDDFDRMEKALRTAERAIVECHEYRSHLHFEELREVRAALHDDYETETETETETDGDDYADRAEWKARR